MSSLLSRGAAALAVAVTAGLSLVVLSPTGDDAAPAPAGPVTVAAEWPGAARAELPGSLPDGPSYQPVYLLAAGDAIGTAPTPDASALRLVRRAPDGTLTELHRERLARNPVYGGYVHAGDTFAFSVSTDAGTTLWTVNPAAGGRARALTADTGDIAFFNSQYDMVIAEGRLHWVAVGPGDEPVTEIRSVALTGGPVRKRIERGAWALAAWPTVVSASGGQLGPVQIRDLRTNRTKKIAATGAELATCGATWCRVLVLATGAPARIDLMRPDGAERQRVAGGDATAAAVDVAVLDRFEVLTVPGPDTGSTSNQELYVYDITTKRTVRVATGVGVVICRGGLLWWSTGDIDEQTWHTLDLRTTG